MFRNHDPSTACTVSIYTPWSSPHFGLLLISRRWGETGPGWGRDGRSRMHGDRRRKPVPVWTWLETESFQTHFRRYHGASQNQEPQCVWTSPDLDPVSRLENSCLLRVSIRSDRAWAIGPRRMGRNIRTQTWKDDQRHTVEVLQINVITVFRPRGWILMQPSYSCYG